MKLKEKMVKYLLNLNYQNIDIKVFFDKKKTISKRLANNRYL